MSKEMKVPCGTRRRERREAWIQTRSQSGMTWAEWCKREKEVARRRRVYGDAV